MPPPTTPASPATPSSEQPPAYNHIDWNELTTEQQQILEKLAEEQQPEPQSQKTTKQSYTSRLLKHMSSRKNKMVDKLRQKKNGIKTWWNEEGKAAVCGFLACVVMFGVVILIFAALSVISLAIVI
jgi:hypothetical protein